MSILTVDMGGTNIKIGLVDHGTIVKRETIPAHSDRGIDQALARTVEVLNTMRDGTCTGVGFAFPTLVDVRTNRICGQMIGKFEGLTRIDFRDWAMKTLGLPVRIENDAHAAILGEWKFGAGRGCDDIVMVTLGTGVGTSVIIGGKPLRGRHAQAGNLGSHMVIDPNGFPCVCGGRGCSEAQQHLNAVNQLARADPAFPASALSSLPQIDYAALFELAPRDELANRLLRRTLDIWGAMTVSLVHQFDCERIVFGGGIMRSGDVIVPHLKKWIASACTPWGRAEVVAGTLGDDAALIGMSVSLNQPLDYI